MTAIAEMTAAGMIAAIDVVTTATTAALPQSL
jgi:hypothetical protein